MSELAGGVNVYGAVSRDVFPEPGDISPDHNPGAKVPWVDGVHDERSSALLDAGTEWHLGGNGMNIAARLATESSLKGRVGFVSVLGTNDEETSRLAREHMEALGIKDLTVAAPGYTPSTSIVESQENGDRMIITKPRGPMERYLTAEHIAKSASDAGLVIATSLKTADLAGRVLDNTPQEAFRAYSPGSTELRDHLDGVRQLLSRTTPGLLAVNEDELLRIVGGSRGSDRLSLLREAVDGYDYAKNILCTLGAEGIILTRKTRHGAEHTYHKVEPAKNIENTIGAGDRAMAIGALGLAQEENVLDVLARIETETARVVQHKGPHQDIYPPGY